MDVVATTSLVLQLTNTCMNVMHIWQHATKLQRFAVCTARILQQSALQESFSKETSCKGPAPNHDSPECLRDGYVMGCFDRYVGFCLEMLIFQSLNFKP